VSSSRALKWFVLLLLPLTLGWKLVVYSYDSDEGKEKNQNKVAHFLVRQHYDIVGTEEVTGEMPMIHVTAGACRMLVALTSPRGWHRDMLQKLATPADRTFVVFRGKIYPEQPMVRTIFSFLWFKSLSQLGLKVYPTPVIAVIETPNCEAERLPWNELG
jgi:hypothetical protein